MMRLQHIEYLWALLIIPVLIILFMFIQKWRKSAINKFTESSLLESIIPDLSLKKHGFKFVMYLLALILLIIGIANPQIGSKTEEVKREGVDLIIAIDVSNSMQTEDLAPNRLEYTKRAIEKLIKRLHGDRLGLIVFAGQAYVQLPLTSDYSAAKLFTTTIGTDIVPVQGTAIGTAINEGLNALKNDNSNNKAIIVITDGENHEDNAVDFAQQANEQGVVVHTIGMGSVKGGPIPIYRNGVKNGFRKDREGNTIISKLNQNMLQEIASAGGGIYVRATNANTGLDAIMEQISQMEKAEYESTLYTDYEDRFQPFILGSLLLLILDFFITVKKNRLGENVNLFKS